MAAVAHPKGLFHPNEPDAPSVKTAIPGPKSQQRLSELSRIQVQLSTTDVKYYQCCSLSRSWFLTG